MISNIEYSDPILIAMVASLVSGIMLGAIFGRMPGRFHRFMRGIVRIATAPLRRIGILRKAQRGLRGARNAAISGNATIKFLEGKTEIEKAIFLQRHGLFKTGEVIELSEKQIREFEKQKRAVEKQYLLRQRGILYEQIRTLPSYAPDWLVAGLSEETVREFVERADEFFNGQVVLDANEEALYEDVDGANTIYLFGKTDLAAYNLLNEARKTINKNALKLIMSFLFIMISAFTIVIGFTQTDASSGFVFIGAALLMSFSWYMYKTSQEHSIRSLAKFMQLYVGHISDQFRDVTGKALGVPVGREEDTAKLAAEARDWNKIMVWMAMRSFFIETFLRNQQFQIFRNVDYYKMFSDGVIFVLVLGAGTGHFLGLYDLPAYVASLPTWQPLAAVGILILYAVLVRRRVIPVELQQQDWRGFDNLQLGKKMDEVVGKYVEEIGYWKTRLDR